MSGIQATDEPGDAGMDGVQEQFRGCTCHPDDNPPVPCQRKYALNDCRLAASSKGPASMREGDGVTVKPLEWLPLPERSVEGQNEKREYLERAVTPFAAIFLMVKDGAYSLSGLITPRLGTFATADEAKAAAQADFEQRIRAAILSATTPGEKS